MDDRYRNLRELPFPMVLNVLGLDASRYKLRKGDTEWAGPCPVHQPKRNSTSFSYAADGKWNCFSCSAKGRGAIDLCMKVRTLGFQEAVNLLQPHVGQAIVERIQRDGVVPKLRMERQPVTENPPFKSTYEKYFDMNEWFTERGLREETLDRYAVGFYENDMRKSAYNGSVMLRISRYSDGATVGYLVRNIGEITPEKPKYRFPEGLHKNLELWGAWQLKEKAPHRIVYLVESPFTVMHFAQLGLPAVSPFGWSVSAEQLAILKDLARGVVYLPDRDKAKEAGTVAGLIASSMWCRMPPLPEDIDDPEHLSLEQIKALT